MALLPLTINPGKRNACGGLKKNETTMASGFLCCLQS